MTFDPPENSIFRLLDAAINRAGEGIRVVEDYARMQLSDKHLSVGLKQLRHDLTTAVSGIDSLERIAARDSIGDVGRTISTDSEYRRDATAGGDSCFSHDVIRANTARAQQAFRTIEEFSKTLDEGISRHVEQLRYRLYTLEKAVLTTVVSQKDLSDSNLYVLIDGCHFDADQELQSGSSRLAKMVKQLIEADVDLIQFRDKSLSDRQLVAAGQIISAITRGTKTRFIMNDRADLAIATFADGVHLGQDDLAVVDARRILGAGRMIGVSTHTIEQARQAVLDGANYIGVGPVYPSATKNFKVHVGLELIKQCSDEIQLPAFAIGGIDLENIGSVIRAGIGRVAVSAAIWKAEFPDQEARAFKNSLDCFPEKEKCPDQGSATC